MQMARVIGDVVATRKDANLDGTPLLLVQPIGADGKDVGRPLVAVDSVGAGVGETVLIVSGSSARMASGMKDMPVDAAVVGIVDTVDVAE